MQVSKGERLATVADPFTVEVVDELVAPQDGVCYATTQSGPIRRGRFVALVADGV